MRAYTTVYRRVVVGYRLPGDPIPTLRAASMVTALDPDDIPAYLALRPDQSPRVVAQRLENGQRCLVTWEAGRLVDAAWLSSGPTYVPYLEAEILLEPGELFVFDSFTSPRVRGIGHYQAKNARICQLAREEGVRRILAVVALENRAPLLITRRIGTRFLGLYHYVRLGPWRRDRSESWTGEALPELRPTRDPRYGA
jgi:hypothetical protein